jgi:murein DD-endopeptidase MepM/ murein hydrolase activator NlpD
LKQHTLIFVPHARAKFRKWRFSTSQALLVIAPLALVTIGGIVAIGLWLSASFDRQQLDQIEQENAELRSVNSRFETSIHDLESKLQDYQARIHKLAIVAGVSDLTPTTEPGLGGVDRQPIKATGASPSAFGGDPRFGNLEELAGQAQTIEQSMSLLQQSFDDRRLRLSNMPTIAPVKGIVTSGFGNRRDPFTGRLSFHEGLDIVAPTGKEVHATGDGIVTKAGMESGYGRVVYVSHGFGVTSVFGHLSGFKVEQGQKVKRGQVVGFVGSSGRSTGNHLHYEVRLDGQSTNPQAYILDDVDQ